MSIDKLRTITDEELTNLIHQGLSKAGMLRHLGLSANHTKGRYLLVERLNALSLAPQSNQHQRTYTRPQFERAMQDASCWSDVCKNLGLSVCGHNYDVLKKFGVYHGIDCSHFDIKQTFRRNKKVYTYEEIYCENSTFSRQMLNRKTKQLKVLEYKCQRCGNDGTWCGEYLGLELDHINGVHDDNRVENLRWVCPNCHSQTPTYKGKNIK